MVRWEQMFLGYDSVARSPDGTPRGFLDQYSKSLRVNSIETNLSMWFSTRIRLAAQWSMYYFPGRRVDDRHLNNQALAPGSVVAGDRGTRGRSDIPTDVGYNDPTYYRPSDLDARFLHEVSARVQFLLP
jgi:hypothetical protein